MAVTLDDVRALLDRIKVSAPDGQPAAADPVEAAREVAPRYFELAEDDRILLRSYYSAYEKRSFEARTAQSCARALDTLDTTYVWAALMLLELGSQSTDWRMNLVDLLVLDHTLRRLEGQGVDFPTGDWDSVSPDTFEAYRRLDERHPDMRNLESVDLMEIQADGHTAFIRNPAEAEWPG
jgi:hypothetical protein